MVSYPHPVRGTEGTLAMLCCSESVLLTFNLLLHLLFVLEKLLMLLPGLPVDVSMHSLFIALVHDSPPQVLQGLVGKYQSVGEVTGHLPINQAVHLQKQPQISKAGFAY